MRFPGQCRQVGEESTAGDVQFDPGLRTSQLIVGDVQGMVAQIYAYEHKPLEQGTYQTGSEPRSRERIRTLQETVVGQSPPDPPAPPPAS